MGEKGLDVDPALAATGLVSAGAATVSTSTVEKATTMITSTVSDAGGDFVETVKKKGLESTAENVIEEGRNRITRRPRDNKPNEPESESADD